MNTSAKTLMIKQEGTGFQQLFKGLGQRHTLLIRLRLSSSRSISRRQRNKRLDKIPLRRATKLMLDLGSDASATSRRFSSTVNGRRFPGCGPSITSISSGVFVIGPSYV
jgi:hypothetical protein